MEKRSAVGPDRGWSWVIAFSACFTSLILSGIFRTSGVLLVAFIHEFGVTREEASWPVVLCLSVLNLTGIVTGALGQRFGVRPVVMFGSIVATVGISSCYVTTSLGTITILFGVVFGVGYGLVTTLMPVVVNEFFLEYRATANGIANSGSCIGSIILPLAFEYFIGEYGLSGCFLLTGGIVLHVAIFGALMRPAPWLQKTKCSNMEASSNISDINILDQNKMRENTTGSFCATHAYDAVIRSIERRGSCLKCKGDCIEVEKPSLEEITEVDLTTKTYGIMEEGKMSLEEGIYRLMEEKETQTYGIMQEGKMSLEEGIYRSMEEKESQIYGIMEEGKMSLEEGIYRSMEEKESLNKVQEVHNNSFKLTNEYKSFHNSSSTTDCRHTVIPYNKLSKLIFFRQNSYTLEKQHQCSRQNLQQQDVNNKSKMSQNFAVSTYGVNFASATTSNAEISEVKKNLSKLPDGTNQTYFPKLRPSILTAFRSVLSCPMFYVTAGANVSFYFLYHMYVVIIVDFSLDRGVPDKDAKYVIFAFALSDFVGRLCLGWVTDRKLLRRQHYVMGCMLLIGFTFFSFPFVYSFVWIVIVSCIYGVLLGCTMVVFPILLVDFLGIETYAVSMGCTCFLNGLATLLRPALIGYFRDNLGSYSNIFYVLGGISVSASFLWLLENCFGKAVKTDTENSVCKNVYKN